jgi:hypothetical protein
MDTIFDFLDGKKTYIAAAVTAALGAAQALGYEIPEWTYALLGAFGLTSLRAAVRKKG